MSTIYSPWYDDSGSYVPMQERERTDNPRTVWDRELPQLDVVAEYREIGFSYVHVYVTEKRQNELVRHMMETTDYDQIRIDEISHHNYDYVPGDTVVILKIN